MKTIEGKIEGGFAFEEDSRLRGIIVGDCTVLPHVAVELNGIIVGKLTLQPSSTAVLHGIVNGDIHNEGGNLSIFGVVNGRVLRHGGVTEVDPAAIIRDGLG